MQQYPVGCGRDFIMVQAIRAAQPARRLAIRAPNWTVDGWRRGPLIRERSLSGLALPPGILSHRKLVAFQRNAKCPPCQTLGSSLYTYSLKLLYQAFQLRRWGI